MNSNDPEPPVGTTVVDSRGRLWVRFDTDRRCWAPLEDDGTRANNDPESWVRVAGNCGPVEITERYEGKT